MSNMLEPPADTKLWTAGTPVIILALVGGVAGGFLYGALDRTVHVQAASPRVIQASGLELVNQTGKRVGFLGVDDSGNIGLTFFDPQGKKRAALSVGRGETPRLDINGPGGDSLLSLDLRQHSKPRLMLSDPDFTGRVFLGVVEPDAPDPEWKYDTWVLRFAGDKTRPLAVVGMTTSGAGGVSVYDQAGHEWGTPLKQ